MVEDRLLAIAGQYFVGASRYLDTFLGSRDLHPRVYVQCRLEGVGPPFLALVDTGAHFCILNEDIADLVWGNLVDGLGGVKIQTAYGLVEGELYRHPLSLVATFGEPLDIEANIFVVPGWQAPCFIGYAGVLDRVRFAIDPGSNRFYFGTLDQR